MQRSRSSLQSSADSKDEHEQLMSAALQASIIRKGPEEAAFSADPPTEMLVPPGLPDGLSDFNGAHLLMQCVCWHVPPK